MIERIVWIIKITTHNTRLRMPNVDTTNLGKRKKGDMADVLILTYDPLNQHILCGQPNFFLRRITYYIEFKYISFKRL